MLEKLGVYLRISAKVKESEILIKDMTRMKEGTYVNRVVQFGTICAVQKKHEKHPWRSVTFSKVGGWSNNSPWVFFRVF